MHLSKDDPRFQEYQKRRDRILDAITFFRFKLLAFQKDPESQREGLSEATKDLSKILLAEVSKSVTEGDKAKKRHLKVLLGLKQ